MTDGAAIFPRLGHSGQEGGLSRGEFSQCHFSDSRKEKRANTLMLRFESGGTAVHSQLAVFRCSISSRFWTDECKADSVWRYIFKHLTFVSFFCLLFHPYAD